MSEKFIEKQTIVNVGRDWNGNTRGDYQDDVRMCNFIISDISYSGQSIPHGVQGADILLIRADGSPVLVDDKLKRIRKGEFTKIVQISTYPANMDVKIQATSEDSSYSFNVIVYITCKVANSVDYFMQHLVLNIKDQISRQLSLIVRPEAKKFNIIEDGIENEISKKLKEKDQYISEFTGVVYSVDFVEVTLDPEAQIYKKKIIETRHNVWLEQNKLFEFTELKHTVRNYENTIVELNKKFEELEKTHTLELAKNTQINAVKQNIFEDGEKAEEYQDEYYKLRKNQLDKLSQLSIICAITGCTFIAIGIIYALIYSISNRDFAPLSIIPSAFGVFITLSSKMLLSLRKQYIFELDKYLEHLMKKADIANKLKIAETLNEKQRDDAITEIIKQS